MGTNGFLEQFAVCSRGHSAIELARLCPTCGYVFGGKGLRDAIGAGDSDIVDGSWRWRRHFDSELKLDGGGGGSGGGE
jgi:hypothetical protein